MLKQDMMDEWGLIFLHSAKWIVLGFYGIPIQVKLNGSKKINPDSSIMSCKDNKLQKCIRTALP